MSTTTASPAHMAPASAKKAKKAKKGRSLLPLFLLVPIMLVLVVLMEAGFLLVLFGVIPTIIAFYADTSDERLKVSTIACCNLSGVLPYALRLHAEHNSWSRLTAMLSDPMIWLQMYGMAGLGYMLIRFCPMLYHTTLRAINRSIAFQVEQRQEVLVKEWGEGIRVDTEGSLERKTLMVNEP